jgi:glutamyl-Q tRNA(Asp) synthetase
VGRIGRFAPSPTGDLHFGSLVAAVASCLNVRSVGGHWLIRVEDLDPPREVRGSSDRILEALQSFGMRSDMPVLFQSTRFGAHRAAVERLLTSGAAYWCGCSRSELPSDGIYPGTCRAGLPAGKSPRAVRLKTEDQPIRFHDRIQGEIREVLSETTGDFIVWRADGLPAYQLAVVVDDAYQAVTEVVRGYDLLASTARQIHVQRCLGIPEPAYAHHPVVVTSDGQKLSKRLGADPIEAERPLEVLRLALRFLGQPCPLLAGLGETWRWALANWNVARVPAATGLGIRS